MAHEITETDNLVLAGKAAWHGLGVVTENAPTPMDAIRLAGLDWRAVVADLYAHIDIDEDIAAGLNAKREKHLARIAELDAMIARAAATETDVDTIEGLNEQHDAVRHEIDQIDRAIEAGVVRVPVPTHAASIRSDTLDALGVASASYTPVQNQQLAELAYELRGRDIDDGEIEVESAGSLQAGRKVWMLLRHTSLINVASGNGDRHDDTIRPYVAMTNGHDGGTAFGFFPTPIRIVCANTYRAAERATGDRIVRFMHTPSIKQRIESSMAAMRAAIRGTIEWSDVARKMARNEMSDEAIQRYYEEVWERVYGAIPKAEDAANDVKAGRKRKRALALVHEWQTIRSGDKQSQFGVDRTAWGAWNGISEWADHRKRYHARDDSRLMASAYSRLFGGAHDVKRIAWNVAREMAGV